MKQLNLGSICEELAATVESTKESVVTNRVVYSIKVLGSKSDRSIREQKQLWQPR
jgi:hypothetical protein